MRPRFFLAPESDNAGGGTGSGGGEGSGEQKPDTRSRSARFLAKLQNSEALSQENDALKQRIAAIEADNAALVDNAETLDGLAEANERLTACLARVEAALKMESGSLIAADADKVSTAIAAAQGRVTAAAFAAVGQPPVPPPAAGKESGRDAAEYPAGASWEERKAWRAKHPERVRQIAASAD